MYYFQTCTIFWYKKQKSNFIIISKTYLNITTKYQEYISILCTVAIENHILTKYAYVLRRQRCDDTSTAGIRYPRVIKQFNNHMGILNCIYNKAVINVSTIYIVTPKIQYYIKYIFYIV